jgi:acyl carrier protein
MENQAIETRIKEILVEVLNLSEKPEELGSEKSLFGTATEAGLFDDSLAVLEVTSVLMAEFDVEASIFNENSFTNIGTLATQIASALEEANA